MEGWTRRSVRISRATLTAPGPVPLPIRATLLLGSMVSWAKWTVKKSRESEGVEAAVMTVRPVSRTPTVLSPNRKPDLSVSVSPAAKVGIIVKVHRRPYPNSEGTSEYLGAGARHDDGGARQR